MAQTYRWSQILQQTTMRAQRKRRRSDDPFFIPGDNLALQNPENIIISYVDENQSVQEDESKENGGNGATEYDEPPSLPFSCCAPHCNERFETSQESRIHYETHHRFECAECGAIYPNEHLLDIVSNRIIFHTARASWHCLHISTFLSSALRRKT